MQLTAILLITVSILTVLSGFTVLVGAQKDKRGPIVAYFLTAAAGAAWGISMALFMSARPGQEEYATTNLIVMYVSTLIDIMMLFLYVGWRRRATWFFMGLVVIATVWLSITLALDSSWLFAEVILRNDGGNTVVFNKGHYLIYIALCMVVIVGFTIVSWYEMRKSRNKRQKSGLRVLLYGLVIAGALGGIFDLLLPFYGNYSLIWIGPIASSLAVVMHYYAILRYRLVVLSSGWLKILSYVILICLAATGYMIIFYIMFTAIFKIPNPSLSIITLNFLMILVVLLLMPVLNEAGAYIRSLIMVGKIDIPYVIKKLERLAGQKTNLNELAEFLADHLHYNYVGIVMRGRLYGSGTLPIAADELKAIGKLPAATSGVWQDLNAEDKELFSRLGLTAAAEMKDEKGREIGQVIFGEPLGRRQYTRRDLIQVEMVVNLVASVVGSEKKKKV